MDEEIWLLVIIKDKYHGEISSLGRFKGISGRLSTRKSKGRKVYYGKFGQKTAAGLM